MPHLRTRLVALTSVVAAVLSTAGVTHATAGQPSTSAPTSLPGLQRLLADSAGTGLGIARLAAVPTADEVAALSALSLTVQPMHELPLALVKGTDAQMQAAVADGIAQDVYPDETLQYTDTASSDEVSSSKAAAEALRARGFTGKGVTVGIVDSGCDATHPDLADHVAHNVTLLSPEYANQEPTADNTLVVPADQGPYDNTDLGSGHGTHVAGIIAADGTSGKRFLGVAPDARLACFSIGAVITTTAVVTAFDYMLRQKDMFGIDVVNNSWGNSFRQYDPHDPVNVATRAVSRRGAVVVFAAGNSGSADGEASTSPFNQAPWVISVAASDLDRKRGDFSSNGLRLDNNRAEPIGAGGHTVFRGDARGVTQPDISAPGVGISSSCDATGTVIGPCPDHGNETASGTSMASPHIAGAAAVLLQANPHLTPLQVQKALEATASPMTTSGKDPRRLDSWQVGYGHVNLDRAVSLVRGAGWRDDLRAAYHRATRRLSRDDGWRMTRTDTWQEAAPPASAGPSYTATHKVTVDRRTDALKVTVVYPSTGQVGANFASYSATVTDAHGKVVGTTTTNLLYSTGVAHTLVKGLAPGTYTVTVTGDYSASDPDTIDSDSVNGRVVFLQAAQLVHR